MKILMVSSFLPYPLFSGGQVRLYNLLRELSSKHEITLICEIRDNQTGEDVHEIEKICKKVITVARRKQWSFKNILNTSFSGNSFLVTGHTNEEMKEKIGQELEKEKFDLIHVETYYVMQNLPETLRHHPGSPSGHPGGVASKIPVVLAEHNIEYQVYKKYVDQVTPILKPLLSMDIAKIRKEEEGFWERADKLIAVSKEDKKVMEMAGREPALISNGVDTEKFEFNPSTRSARSGLKKILFIGDFKWMQNRDAVEFIIKEIWPSLRQGLGGQAGNNLKLGLKMWIVGRKIPDSIKGLTTDPDIIFDEESSGRPTEELFQEADILLAPIRVGGGTSYKILEAMSSGTPVVVMPLSAEAIGARDAVNIMIGKDAQELADKTMELLSDEKLYKKIAKNGRTLIEEKYTWKKIANDLENVYESMR